MRLIRANGASIAIVGNHAVKWFHGPGAIERYNRDKVGYMNAIKCIVWASHALHVKHCGFRTTIASLGAPFTEANHPELFEFVNNRVSDALRSGSVRPAKDLLPMPSIQYLLKGADRLAKEVNSALAGLHLPSGPTHGDLHRRNLLLVGTKIRVIDFDRYRICGCPLFDKVHFQLREIQLLTEQHWLDCLCAHSELIRTSTNRLIHPRKLFVAYALQRIGHEGHAAALRGKSLEKYSRQVEQALSHFGRI